MRRAALENGALFQRNLACPGPQPRRSAGSYASLGIWYRMPPPFRFQTLYPLQTAVYAADTGSDRKDADGDRPNALAIPSEFVDS
jgi:hypothetical protein